MTVIPIARAAARRAAQERTSHDPAPRLPGRLPESPVVEELPRRGGDRPVALPLHRGADAAPARTTEPAAHATVATATAVEVPLTEPQLAARLFPLAALAAAADLLTKAWAVAALAERSIALGPWLSLSLTFNRASAGGVSLGDSTRAVNFSATGIVIGLLVMLAPELARVDRRSWRAVALIVGAGLGNMTSLLRSDRGVPDFIALHHGTGAWVLNVADVVLVVGLALLAGTVVRLARRARATRAARPVVATAARARRA